MLEYRVNVKVHNRNPFLYGIPGYDEGRWKHLRACSLLRKYAAQCGAEHPERLRGTQLRKQLATQCADMNIDENQVVDLANFMGHAEKIHREHYRQPVARRDVCGISKLLETASGIKQASGSENTPEENTIDTERESNKKKTKTESILYILRTTKKKHSAVRRKNLISMQDKKEADRKRLTSQRENGFTRLNPQIVRTLIGHIAQKEKKNVRSFKIRGLCTLFELSYKLK